MPIEGSNENLMMPTELHLVSVPEDCFYAAFLLGLSCLSSYLFMAFQRRQG